MRRLPFLLFIAKNYFLTVSVFGFTEVSGGFVNESFLTESTFVTVESVVEVDLFPEQEAKETAKAKAKAPNLMVFFIFLILNCD
ncbi:hypothetical protein ACFGVR_18315 [Mucilaginibacter sp. AW1-3]